ncbi:LINE-1 type transposase domain containing protein 1 [Dissostichus eleginoides]|uniref:LINE-1 type transposase domain containing protein 1 n=1 Tax=Dissostichus eleginoides TaxID=100907 RepID=A0AAD9C328_DISEL|nr:LINE-1 type transposase domain containing protein 1 [Dissostichus eleginoides]
MKSELVDMKQEMYQKLSANSALTQAHETRLEEAEKRIDEVETVNMAMSDALIKSMKQKRAMQGKLVDLERRSRRNNMRIYGVPEEKEGNSMPDFVDQLLRTELTLPDTNLQIQRAHRAVARKPERNAPPRLRIHWDSGTRTYDSAQDAAQELRRRGFSVEIPDRNASELYPEIEHLHQTKTWQHTN